MPGILEGVRHKMVRCSVPAAAATSNCFCELMENNFFPMAQQSIVGRCHLIIVALRSHSSTHTHTHTFGRIPLDKGSARRKDLCLTHNTHKRQTSMPPVEFEHAKPASERPHTHARHRATTWICTGKCYLLTYSMEQSPSWEANWFCC